MTRRSRRILLVLRYVCVLYWYMYMYTDYIENQVLLKPVLAGEVVFLPLTNNFNLTESCYFNSMYNLFRKSPLICSRWYIKTAVYINDSGPIQGPGPYKHQIMHVHTIFTLFVSHKKFFYNSSESEFSVFVHENPMLFAAAPRDINKIILI